MVRRFELYVRVARAISHECAQRTSEILFLPWEHKIHIFELTCIMFFLLYKHTDNGVFDDFPKISDHFPKISEDFSKLFRRPEKHSRTFSENFRKFTKMSEDCRRLSRKIGRCFDDTTTNLSTIQETNLISVKSSISSHMRVSYRFYQFVTTRITLNFYII